MITTYSCLVCGWKGLERKPEFPFSSHEICACCGSEYGLDIQKETDIEKVRTEWLQEGAAWFDDENDINPRKPKNWCIQLAKRQIQDIYGGS